MSYLRRASTKNLIIVIFAVCALAGGGAAVATAAAGGGPTPPPEQLDQAITDALAAAQPAGVTADVQLTNNLFPSGALLGQTTSALIAGGSGRLWLTNDGHGRIELQSDAGDVQIVWDSQTISVYDASSDTVYRANLPRQTSSDGTDTNTSLTLAEVDGFLTNLGVDWALSGAQPADVAGQPAYSVSISPKRDGGLFGSLQLAWDASNGTPLQAAINAQGNSTPVLKLAVNDISYGPVAASDVNVAPPADAKVVDLSSASTTGSDSSKPAVTGLAAVQAAAPFKVVTPNTLGGLPRHEVRLIGGDAVLAQYGQGLDGIMLVERQAEGSGSSGGLLSNLPTVSLDGLTAHELASQLGTILEWQSGGTSYVLAGSLPPAAAEGAARALK